ncbi:MAG: hypothetical protein GF393_02845 [Armatimonadia bacterium]|nr:hypothetical protein [Armatimonadia bacterium]
MMKRAVIATLLTVLLACGPCFAEEMHSVLPAVGAVCLTTDQPVTIDGDLSDAAWDGAPVVSGFRISALEELAPNQTEFMMLRDAGGLYIAARCHEENMAGLKETVTMRDGSVWHDDDVELFFDVDHDHDDFYQLMANSLGTRFDSKTGANTWDAEWQAATSKEAEAWLLEMAIPWEALETDAPDTGDVWGFNVARERQAGRSTVLSNWANVQGNFLRPWLFGHVYFAGENFVLTEEVARRLHTAIEVPVEMYLDGRIALVTEKGVEESATYQELLAEAFGGAADLRDLHAELAEAFAENPDAPHQDEFAPLDARFREIRALATGQEPVSPAQWATQTITIDTLQTQLHELKWKVKIALLLREA